MERLHRAAAPYRCTIPADIIPTLRALRARQDDWRELIEVEDVVHLHYGLGPAWFLATALRLKWAASLFLYREAVKLHSPG